MRETIVDYDDIDAISHGVGILQRFLSLYTYLLHSFNMRKKPYDGI